MRYPLLRGDELENIEKSTAEAIELQTAGIDTLVELTPIGLGRIHAELPKSPNAVGFKSSSPPVFTSKRIIHRSIGFTALVRIQLAD